MELIVKNLKYGFKDILFQNVNFKCKEGDILTILGPNGSGKTTFLNCLLFNFNNYEGEIIYDGRNNKTLSIKERSNLVAYVDSKNDDTNINVFDYLALGLVNKKKFYEAPNKEDFDYILKILKKFNIEKFADRLFSTLSDGEKKIVKICKVYIQKASIIIFDEPTANLDLKNEVFVLKLINDLAKEGKIIINVTHNPNHCLNLNGYVLLLGLNALYGNVDSIVTENNLTKLYGVPISIMTDDKNNKRVLY